MVNPAPLNIVHVILSRGFAGSERSTAESCNQQCNEHQVTLIVRRDHRMKGQSIVDHVDRKVIIVEVASHFFTRILLKRALLKIKPDIVHCHLRRSTRLVARSELDAATVSTLHITVNGPHFVRMDGLICNAKWQLSDIPASYKGLVLKANNSLIPHPGLDQKELAKLRHDLNIDDNELLIAAVGRYKNSKGWDTLINAFARLKQYKHARLLFFGAGSLEADLKDLAQADPRIRFIGYRDDIKDLYQAFDLLVCPSRFEPLPRVILEAMDGGVPVIASDIGGCLELIEDYGGVSFKVDNVEDLTDKLAKCIDNPPARHRPDLSAHYIENANQAMLEFYRRLIEAREPK